MKHTDEIDDVLQEVSMTMWSKWKDFKKGTNFLAWAKAIAHFKVLRCCHLTKKRPSTVTDEVIELLQPTVEPFDQTIHHRSEHLGACLRKLDPIDQQLIRQKYAKNADGNELAEHFGWRKNYVYKRIGKLKESLALCIKSREKTSTI